MWAIMRYCLQNISKQYDSHLIKTENFASYRKTERVSGNQNFIFKYFNSQESSQSFLKPISKYLDIVFEYLTLTSANAWDWLDFLVVILVLILVREGHVSATLGSGSVSASLIFRLTCPCWSWIWLWSSPRWGCCRRSRWRCSPSSRTRTRCHSCTSSRPGPTTWTWSGT